MTEGAQFLLVLEPNLANAFLQLTQNQAYVPPDCVWTDVTIGDGTKKRIPTYVAPLLTDPVIAGYDPLIVDTVAWCMAHKPRDRPTMLELEERLFANTMSRDWAQEDESGRITIRELLARPPPPRPA